jgi:hypothetical protein
MTYLFLIVGISVINALSNQKVSYAELLFTNAAVIGITWYLEKVWMLKREDFMDIRYEKIDLIVPSRHEELLEDLRKRTGLNIYRVTIHRINFMRDTARIRIFYKHDPELAEKPDEKTNPKT